ncbi:Bacterial Ig-like domain protein [anaerobic digester metagenome]
MVPVPQVTGAKAIDANDVATTLPATDVKANSTYEVAFSADVDPLTVNTGTIFITQDGVKQLATISYSSDDKAATIEMSAGSLTPGKDYVLTVNGVKDTNGVAVKSFTTDFTISINPLLLSATYADAVLGATTNLNGAVVDNATETITFTFNKDIDTNTVSTSTVKIYDITDAEYLVCTVASTNATTFTVANTTNFETEHDYRLELRSGIEDLAGNALAATNIDFFYGYSAVTVGTSIPAANATGVYNSITASGGNEGFKFKAPFSAAVNPATVSSSTFELVNADTEEVVDGTVTYEAGSYYLIFTPKADLAENTTYTATIDGVKTTKGIAVAKTVRSFTTGDFADPTVVSTTPANAADDVGIGADMVITFSKEMAPATLTMGTNITLIDVSNSNSVVNISAWTASLSQDGKVFTIKIPSASQLNPDHTYKLTVKKAVSDTASPANTLAADVEVLFNTENAAATTLLSAQVGTSYSVSNTVIESGATNVLNTNKIYLNFSQALKTDAGSYVLGDLVKLEQKAVGGSYTTVNETATLVNSNKSIQMVLAAGNWVADNTYRITIPTTVKDVNGNAVSKVEFEFTVGTAPAVAPATSYPATFAVNVDTEAPRLAVIIDDTNSDLMASTLNSDTVKVVKKSDSSVAPYTISTINYAKKNVAATATTNGTTTVVLNADTDGIVVGNILSIASDGTYVVTAKTGTTLTVDRATANGGGGNAITYHQGVVYTLDTDAELDSYTEYNVVVDGVKDAAGNPVTATTYTFRTETVTNNLEVESATVSNGATGIATGQKVELVFNEPVTNVTSGSSFVNVAGILDGATTRIAFQTAAGTAVTGTYKLSSDAKTMTFYPNGYLATGTVYNVVIDSTTASAGGAMDEDYTFSFRTEDTSSAAITSAIYYDTNGDAVIGAGDVIRLTFNTQSLVGTNINAVDDFTVTGPGTTLGSATVGSLSTDNFVDITLAADSVVTPNLSTIKVDGTAATVPTFTTDAVTITK